MSAPVTTPSAPQDYYPLFGDPAWISTGAPKGVMDAAGVWMYFCDCKLSEDASARIVRFNVQTLAYELWLATGTMPAAVQAFCFKADYSGFLFTANDADPSHLRLLDFADQTITDLGDLGGDLINRLVNVPGTDGYVFWRAGEKNLGLLSLDAEDVPTKTENNWRAVGWTCAPDVLSGGVVLRCVQDGGPQTNGPVVRHPVGRGSVTEILGGRFDAGADANGSSAYDAVFSAASMKVNDDGSVVYFTSGDVLKKLAAGAVSTIGTPARTIVAYSAPLNLLVTERNLALTVWS